MRPCLVEDVCGGNSDWGFAAGLVGFGFILLSLAYIVRKQWARLTLGSLLQWLYAHIVLGTVSLILIVAHSGFHLRNHLAVLALFFLALTVLSGVVGLGLFYFLPRSQFRHEAAVMLPTDLCERLSRLHEELSALCSEKGGIYLEIYNQIVIPLYRTEPGSVPPSADLNPWAERMAEGPDEDFVKFAVKIEMVHDLLVLLGAHLKWKWLLEAWLLVHVPATIGLVVFSLAHIIVITWLGVR